MDTIVFRWVLDIIRTFIMARLLRAAKIAWKSLVTGQLPDMTERILVGMDQNGNKYFNVFDTPKSIPRREVEYAGPIDPEIIPNEWRRWMTGLRSEPPTLEVQIIF